MGTATGFVGGSGEATAVEKVSGHAGPPATGAASETPATSTAITATFVILKACEREGTLRHADRSANDGDRVRYGFGSGDLRGARQELAEGTQIGGRTAEHISSATLHAAHPLRKKVRDLLVEAIKHGMDEGFHELAVQEDEFQGNHQGGAPIPGTGDVVQVPKSRPLRKLLESDGMSSLAERGLGWKAAAPAPLAGGEKRKAAQPCWEAKAKAKKSKNTSGVGFSPRHERAGRRGTAIPAAATGASTTTSTAPPTQPVLPHPPPHPVSLDSSTRLSSRSSNRSSSSRRRPRGAGFRSQALQTSAGWLAVVGEAEAYVEAPTRGAAAPGDAVSNSQGSANRQSRQQGGEGARTSGYPVRRRREVRGTSRCTQAWVSFAGPVPR